MKNLKALIKMERTPALVMSIYFLVVNIIAGIALLGPINTNWQRYLAKGVGEVNNWEIVSNIYPITLMVLIGYGIGLLVLVYLQFKKDKSIEISRFIKALPYTNGQRAVVKMGMGILSFTVPFIIYIIMFLFIRNYATNLYGEMLRVTAFEEVATYLNRLSVYLSFIGITYIRLIMIYLILIMCEYLISHNIGSLIIAILSSSAPLYLWFSMTVDIDSSSGTYVYKIGEWFYKVYMNYTNWGRIQIAGANEWDYIDYTITEDGGMVCMIYLVLIVICSLVISIQVKKQRVENADIFIPRKLTRYVFIVGVVLCSGCLVRDIGRLILGEIALGYPRMILHVLLVIGLMVGAFVATKIAHIGIQSKREV